MSNPLLVAPLDLCYHMMMVDDLDKPDEIESIPSPEEEAELERKRAEQEFAWRLKEEARRKKLAEKQEAERIKKFAAKKAQAERDAAKAAETYTRFTEAAKICPAIALLNRAEDWKEFFAARWPFRNTEDLDHLLDGLGKAGLPVRS